MKAVVMAGGEGSRLRPLTLRCPKPLVPVADKPVMSHILDLLKRHGITEVVVTLHYLADQIADTYGDGSDIGMTIHYTVEETPLGTAGSVKQAEDFLKDDSFIIISGDSLTNIDLTQLIEFHRQNKSQATLALVEQPNPLEYGVVVTDSSGRITRFLEKPDWTEAFSNTVNTGIYCLDPMVFDYMDPGESYDWSQDIFPVMLAEAKRLYGFVAEGYWCDIGSLQSYRDAQADALTGKSCSDLYADNNGNRVFVGEGAIVEPGAIIRAPVLIGAGAHIKSGAIVENCSVIGSYSVVQSGARVSGSALWNGVYVGEKSVVEGSVVCRNSTIGPHCRLDEGSILGERTQVHQDSWLGADVKVWPGKIIEAGTHLTLSLISGSRFSGTLFDDGAVRGIPNVEITPEFATKLASAYGSTLNPGAFVVIGRDSHPASRMIKRALLSGLMSAGINILDVHAAPEPMSRYLAYNSQAEGGLHIHMSTSRPSLITLDFFDKNGVALNKSAQRKIENLFGREDYRRAELWNIGKIEAVEDPVARYRNALIRSVDRKLVSERAARILLDCAHGTISTIAPTLMGEVGCRPVTINAYPDPAAEPRTKAEKSMLLEDLSAMVETLSAELGALLDEDATALHLVDSKGRVLSEPMLLLAFTQLVFQTEPGALVVAPTTAPRELEEMAEAAEGRIIRTRNNHRDLVTTSTASLATLGADMYGHFILPSVHGAFDGVAALLDLMQRLTRAGITLADLVDDLPKLYMSRSLVQCSWERKGEIMRRLGEQLMPLKAELNDGVRLNWDDGWVHILPDASSPAFHVLAQADTPQRLDELVQCYTEQLESLEARK